MAQSYLSRHYQYLQERFPLTQFIPLSAIFALSAGIGTQLYLFGQVKEISSLMLAFVALFLFLLRLRLFDEFKDFAHDSTYYSDRPVPRGLVTLKDLGVGIFIVLFIEILIATTGGAASLIFFCVALLYSLFMFKEFFVSVWLKKRFTLYIASHEILIFPLFFYLISINGSHSHLMNQPYFWILVLFLGSRIFLLEVTRKIRPKELEIPSGDTYTAQYGVKGTGILIAILAIMVVLFEISLKSTLFTGFHFSSFLPGILSMVFLFSNFQFVKQPNLSNAKKVFNFSIVFVFITNLNFILSLLL